MLESWPPSLAKKTEDGFETQFGTNHLGHFYLTNLLLPKLREGAPARVVNVSSAAHSMSEVHLDDLPQCQTLAGKFGAKWLLYGQSKASNILFTVELNRRMQEEGIGLSVALHPGAITTELQRHLQSWYESISFYVTGFFFKTAEQGAATSVYCCTAPEIEQQHLGGNYFSDSNEAVARAYASNPETAKKLWDLSEQFVGLKKT